MYTLWASVVHVGVGRVSRASAPPFSLWLLCGNEPCGMRKPTSPNFRRRGDFIGP